MKLVLDDKLRIDPENVKSKLVDFIRSTLAKRNIEGVLVLYKHCIESIINVHLAISAVGRENVKLLVTKGRIINKQPREEMSLATINQYLDLPKDNIVFVNQERALKEIFSIFSEVDVPRSRFSFPETQALNYNLTYFLLCGMVRSEFEEKSYEISLKTPKTSSEINLQETIAYYKSQIRFRMLLAFLLAESENRSFIGSVDKTEWLLGLFTRFGPYHAADLLPLADLYRTQVIQLANYLGLQQFLTNKTLDRPTSYEFFFKLPVKDVDRILIRLVSKFTVEKIVEETGLPLEAIQKVNYYYQASAYARTVPLIPTL